MFLRCGAVSNWITSESVVEYSTAYSTVLHDGAWSTVLHDGSACGTVVRLFGAQLGTASQWQNLYTYIKMYYVNVLSFSKL